MYQTILVPIDGSDGAERAIEHALALGRQNDATLHGIFVVDTSRYGEPALSSAEIVVDDIEDRGQGLLDSFAARVEESGLDATTRCCHGRPDEEIRAYADEIDADLIVMGFQGQSQRREAQIGSVAERVVRSASRPVLTA